MMPCLRQFHAIRYCLNKDAAYRNPEEGTPQAEVSRVFDQLDVASRMGRKSELEEEVQIDATPEELANAVVRPVNIEHESG